jgi:hypothetical protein
MIVSSVFPNSRQKNDPLKLVVDLGLFEKEGDKINTIYRVV